MHHCYTSGVLYEIKIISYTNTTRADTFTYRRGLLLSSIQTPFFRMGKVFIFRKQIHAKKSLQRNDFFIQKRDISSLLQANCHIGRDAKDAILDGQIARMDDIAFSNPTLVFLPEFQEGLGRVVGA